MKQICKIKGNELVKSYYYVTTCGKVISYKNFKVKKLQQSITHDGYARVHLVLNNGKTKHFSVHRLVAQSYLNNSNNYLYVNHIDENKTHNYIKNLEWCTAKYNNNYGEHTKKVVKSNLQNKDINYYETHPIFRGDFKKKM